MKSSKYEELPLDNDEADDDMNSSDGAQSYTNFHILHF